MRGLTCFGHSHRSQVPIESHHVWPLGYHGPNVPANRKDGCANAHSDTHYYLERLLKTQDKIPWAEQQTYGLKIKSVAREGYVQIIAYGEAQAAVATTP